MDSWLLGALAVVLIGITLWIVWPGRASSTSEGTSEDLEAPTNTMTPTSTTPGEGAEQLPPQGDRFEDQYTSATADLSAGGVAAATQTESPSAATVPPQRSTELRGTPVQEPVVSTAGQRWPLADPAGEHIGQAERSENFPFSSEAFESRPLMHSRTLSVGAGLVLSIVGAVGGAWLYSRWQRERNKPINRLRRASNVLLNEASESTRRVVAAAQTKRR
jgi:hypothetical protein